MAFKKEFDINNTGFKADYVNIEVFQIDTTRKGKNSIVVRCAVYKSEEDRRLGANPITHLELQFDDLNLINSVFSLAYSELKKKSEFIGAVDA